MAKLDVATLLSDQLHESDAALAPEVSETGTTDLPDSRSSEVPPSNDSPGGSLHGDDVPSTTLQQMPKYLRLERKDTRLRSDQLDELARLARRLQRGRPQGGGERITENTLIRVGVDLVLALSNCLDGAKDEGELAARALGRLGVT